MTLPIAIRRPTPGDVPFVIDSWLKSYRHDSKRTDRDTDLKHMRDGDFFDENRANVERLLDAPETRTLLACQEGAPDGCYGWICASADAVHYVYVKQPFRKLGIASKLLAAAGLAGVYPLTVTHLTRAVLDWKAKGHDIRYNPYWAWR